MGSMITVIVRVGRGPEYLTRFLESAVNSTTARRLRMLFVDHGSNVDFMGVRRICDDHEIPCEVFKHDAVGKSPMTRALEAASKTPVMIFSYDVMLPVGLIDNACRALDLNYALFFRAWRPILESPTRGYWDDQWLTSGVFPQGYVPLVEKDGQPPKVSAVYAARHYADRGVKLALVSVPGLYAMIPYPKHAWERQRATELITAPLTDIQEPDSLDLLLEAPESWEPYIFPTVDGSAESAMSDVYKILVDNGLHDNSIQVDKFAEDVLGKFLEMYDRGLLPFVPVFQFEASAGSEQVTANLRRVLLPYEDAQIQELRNGRHNKEVHTA